MSDRDSPSSPLISVERLVALLDDPRTLILDATVYLEAAESDGDFRATSGRARWERSHIPGARFADLLTDLSDPASHYHFAMPSPASIEGPLRRLGLEDGKRAIVYDGDSGFWAARLWWMLRSLGIQASVLDGGLARWQQRGHRAESGPVTTPAPQAMTLTLSPDPSAWTSRAQVEAISRGDLPGTLICALSQEVFSGKAPSRYKRRGYIPASLNIPARDLLSADGTYHSDADLQARLEALRATAERPLVLYCGGGISACVHALAFTILGERQLSVYDGSLEEWSADPSLPLTTSV